MAFTYGKRMDLVAWAALLGIISILVGLRNLLATASTWTLTDYPTHIFKLFLLDQHGYGFVSQLWNSGVGYKLFETYPPLFFFIAWPVQKILSLFMPLDSSYVAALPLTGILLLVGIALVLKKFLFGDWIRTLLLVSLVFFNPLGINWIIETGRMPELMGWFVFSIIFALTFHPHPHPFSLVKKILIGILFGLLMIAHPAVFILATIYWFALALAQPQSEWKWRAGSYVLGLILSSWWVIPYQSAKSALLLSTWVGFNPAGNLFITGFFLLSLVVLAMVTYLLYRAKSPEWKTTKVVLVVGLLGLISILSKIPVFNQPHQVTYTLFFLFLGFASLLLYIPKKITSARITKLVGIGLVILTLFFAGYSLMKFSFSTEHNSMSYELSELDSLSSQIKSPYTCIPDCGGENSYLAVVHQVPTIDNFSPEATPISIANGKSALMGAIAQGDCSIIASSASALGIHSILSPASHCGIASTCGMPILAQSKNWCIWGPSLAP